MRERSSDVDLVVTHPVLRHITVPTSSIIDGDAYYRPNVGGNFDFTTSVENTGALKWLLPYKLVRGRGVVTNISERTNQVYVNTDCEGGYIEGYNLPDLWVRFHELH
ncbi:MAG: hypothetical protein ACOZAO_05180 [Patescibacteria group bacterium]